MVGCVSEFWPDKDVDFCLFDTCDKCELCDIYNQVLIVMKKLTHSWKDDYVQNIYYTVFFNVLNYYLGTENIFRSKSK